MQLGEIWAQNSGFHRAVQHFVCGEKIRSPFIPTPTSQFVALCHRCDDVVLPNIPKLEATLSLCLFSFVPGKQFFPANHSC